MSRSSHQPPVTHLSVLLSLLRQTATLSLLLFISLLLNVLQLSVVWLRWLGNGGLHDYRMLMSQISWLYTGLIVCVLECWSGLQIQFTASSSFWCADQPTADSASSSSSTPPSAIWISNHVSYADFVIFYSVAYRRGCLASLRFMVKRVLLYLPGVGWAAWFHEYLFLFRSWLHDQSRLNSKLESFGLTRSTMNLALFPEGTFCEEHRRDVVKRSLEYAEQRGHVKHQYLLTPRHKGFVTAVQHLRNTVTEIVDLTIVFTGGEQDQPTVGRYGCLNSEEESESVSDSEDDENSSLSLSKMTNGNLSSSSPSSYQTPFYSSYLPLLDARRHQPDIFDLINNNPAPLCHVHIDVIPIEQLPLQDEDIRKWLHDRWCLKDKLLQHFHRHGEFPRKRGSNGDMMEGNYRVPIDGLHMMRFLVFWLMFGMMLLYFIGQYSVVLRNAMIAGAAGLTGMALIVSIVLKAR